MRGWEKAAVYSGLRSETGDPVARPPFRSWRFLAQCLLTAALMVASTLVLRAVGVDHEVARWLGIALGAFLSGFAVPLLLRQRP